MASAHSEELSSEFNKYGITASMLLSYSSIDANIQHLPELDIVTNEIILELFKFKGRHPRCTFKTLYYWMARSGLKKTHQHVKLLPEAMKD